MYIEVLVEGTSDVPMFQELLTRKFALAQNVNFRIHPHKGKGTLPDNILSRPDPKQQTLLHQLPAKLRGFSYLDDDSCVVVAVDADDTPAHALISELQRMLAALPTRPANVLFCIAVEETESWLIADIAAVLAAYPRAKVQKLKDLEVDGIVGAWEHLADAVGKKRKDVTGADKQTWTTAIAPHMDLDDPRSPSLQQVVRDLEDLITG